MENNAATSSSLMRKTKTQLVEIIFRKDAKEKEFQKAIKDKETAHITDIKKYSNIIRKLNVEKENIEKRAEYAKNEFEKECDDLTTERCELQTKLSRVNKVNKSLIGIIVIMIGLMLIMF